MYLDLNVEIILENCYLKGNIKEINSTKNFSDQKEIFFYLICKTGVSAVY